MDLKPTFLTILVGGNGSGSADVDLDGDFLLDFSGGRDSGGGLSRGGVGRSGNDLKVPSSSCRDFLTF